MGKCWRIHTDLQPNAEHFICPVCGDPSKTSTISIWGPEDFDIMDSNDCDCLHDDDMVSCSECGGMLFGSELAARIKGRFGITDWIFRPGEIPSPVYVVGIHD